MTQRTMVAAVLGLVLGFLASRMLFLQWLTLIPWGIAAVAIGLFSRSRRVALIDGAAYGFVLGFSFIALGYGGADPVLEKVPFFAVLGLVSAACGMALSIAAFWLRAVPRGRTRGGSG